MEDWEAIHRNHQQAYEVFLQKEKEKYWTKSIADAAEHFKLHITQQVEKGLEDYSAALRLIATDVTQAGAQGIMPDDKVMISRLVRGLTRQIQQKYCLSPLLDPSATTFEIPQGADVINITGDSDPPTPASLNQLYFSWHPTEVKSEPQTGQPGDEEVGQSSLADAAEASQTATPQRQLASEAQASSQYNRPSDLGEAGPSSTIIAQANRSPRGHDPKRFSEILDEEPTQQGSLHCLEVEGQDYIFSVDSFPGYLFVIRCDIDHKRNGITRRHIFSKHPLEYSRAYNHFKQEQSREKCHDVDIHGFYDEGQLIFKFGYRVYGDELEDEEWVARSNEKAVKSSTRKGSPNTGTPRRKRPRATTKAGRIQKGKAVSTSSPRASTTRNSSAGPSTAPRPPGAATTARRRPGPEIGPARRSHPSIGKDGSEVTVTTNSGGEPIPDPVPSRRSNMAPVADMGVLGISPAVQGGRDFSRSSSRTSTRLTSRAAETASNNHPAELEDDVSWDLPVDEDHREKTVFTDLISPVN